MLKSQSTNLILLYAHILAESFSFFIMLDRYKDLTHKKSLLPLKKKKKTHIFLTLLFFTNKINYFKRYIFNTDKDVSYKEKSVQFMILLASEPKKKKNIKSILQQQFLQNCFQIQATETPRKICTE